MKKLLTICLMLLGAVAQAQNFAITATTEAAIRKNIVKGNAANYGFGMINDTLKLVGLTTRNVIFTGSTSKTDIGLGNVDNTSDLNKPVSTATQTALNLKANIASPTFTGTLTAPTIANSLGATFATTSGNVGIGTASPLTKFHVKWIGANNDGLYTPAIIATDGKTTGDGIGLAFYGHNSGNNEKNYGSLNYFITNPTTGAESSELTIRTLNGGSNGDRIKVTSSGNTLIGTTTDAGYKLDVNGTARIVGNSTFSGNLGIGTISPTKKLHVYDNSGGVGNTTIRLESLAGGYGAGVEAGSIISGTSTYLSMGKAVWDGEAAWNSTATTQDSYFTIHTAQDGTVSEKMRITSNGNLGIGTTTPSQKIDVNGNIRAYSINGGGAYYSATSATDAAARNWLMRGNSIVYGDFDIRQSGAVGGDPIAAGNSRFYISNNGRVGIGTTTDAGYLLDVNGTLRTVNDAYFATTSGNVGIGTTAPNAKLHVFSAAAFNRMQVENNGNFHNGLRLNRTGGDYATDWEIYTPSNSTALNFFNGSNRMTMFANGRVGIGTTVDAGYLLDVNGTSIVRGTARFQSLSQAGYSELSSNSTGAIYQTNGHAYFYTNANAYDVYFQKYNSTGTNMIIKDSGNIGIGTGTPNASSILDITSTTQGVLFPRLTTTQISAISSPADGLTVYNTTLKAICFYDSSAAVWKRVSHSNM